MEQLLAQLAAMGGLAALFAVLVDFGKRFGIVKDGTAPTWATGLNLVALVGLFIAGLFKVDVMQLDPLIRNVAQILVLVLSLIGQVATSRATHFVLKDVKGVNFSHSAAMIAIFLFVLASMFVAPGIALAADPPTDEQLYIAACTDQGLLGGLQLVKQMNDQYGAAHQLDTNAKWHTAYPFFTNEAAGFWCNAPVILNPGEKGETTTQAVRIFAPYYRWLYNQLIQFQSK